MRAAKEDPTTPAGWRGRARAPLLAAALAALAACGGPAARAPQPRPLALVMAEDGLLRGSVQVVDPLGRQVSYAVAGLPRHGALTFDVGTGGFTYRPAPDFAGEDAFHFTASAGGLVSAPTPVSITVVQVDDAPRVQALLGAALAALSDAVLLLQLPEDGTATGQVAAWDPEGAHMTYRVVEPPARGALDLDAATGQFTYRPAPDFSGTDLFRFTATDGIQTSAAAAVVLEVAPVNDAPVAASQALQLLEDEAVSGTLTSSDVDGPAPAFAIATPPAHGTVELDAATGAFTYRPEPDWSGADGFSFTAGDGIDVSAPATVGLDVLPVNDAPVALDGALDLDEDGIAAGQVVATDVDGPALVFQVVQAPLHGTLLLDPATGSFTYAPERDWNGDDAFQVVASDGEASSAPANISLRVHPVNDPPVASDQALATDEDVPLAGQVAAADVDGPALVYIPTSMPAHGTLALDPATGAFLYRPAPDWNGTDGFAFVASDGEATSAEATVSLTIGPVDDPPVLPPLPDTTNSAETRETFIALPVRDVDGDLLRYTVTVSDPAIAGAAADTGGTLAVTPLARGETALTVEVTDGITPVSASFRFTVTDVTKLRRWTVADTRAQAVTITNTADHEVAFELRHNGNRLAVTGDQLVEDVRALADEVTGEPFERKLWRFVKDGSYHFDPLTGSYWQHDPLLFLNSIGFGYCDDVTAVFASLGRTAGYATRAWELWGHVVPEIQVDGRWTMYDPDLAVYYHDLDGQVADATQLAASPGLVTAPVARVSTWSWPYSTTVADIYGSSSDNFLLTAPFFVVPKSAPALRLAPGARVTYPGRWAALPVTLYATTPTATAQLRLDLPAGFTGTVDWPLVPWDVQGSGRVRVGGVEYAAGSPEIAAALQGAGRLPQQAALERAVEVLEATGTTSIVYLVNPLRFSLAPETSVEVVAQEAWALDLRLAPAGDASRVLFPSTGFLARPR